MRKLLADRDFPVNEICYFASKQPEFRCGDSEGLEVGALGKIRREAANWLWSSTCLCAIPGRV